MTATTVHPDKLLPHCVKDKQIELTDVRLLRHQINQHQDISLNVLPVGMQQRNHLRIQLLMCPKIVATECVRVGAHHMSVTQRLV